MVFRRGAALGLLWLAACAGPGRFPLREPLTHDDDQRPFTPAPETYVSPFAWDGANQMLFRPVSRFFAVDPAGRAANVNAFDEVADSSWFENRIGRAPMSGDEVFHGPCGDRVLDPQGPDGSWLIDEGKPNGANPGFRVNIPGVGKFLLKADLAEEPERATGATAIAARLYYAAGYFAPCDSVVYFHPRLLSLKPGLTVTDNSGKTRPFDQAALERVLARASHRGGLVRMGASRWLPGKPIGPYRYEGTRDDDPNDVIAHEDRRELRGGRLLAAWLNHFDSREQNTMDVFMVTSETDAQPEYGYVRHYILDLGDCFGSIWAWDAMSRRLGHAYYLDFEYLFADFATFGLIDRPWDHARRDAGVFNYFSARDFDPEDWRGGYPNPAFGRMTEADGAWMARVLARFGEEQIAAAVRAGQYDDASTQYLTRTLVERRQTILNRYLNRLSPIADLQVQGPRLCGLDLARRAGVVTDASRRYSATAQLAREDDAAQIALRPEQIEAREGGLVCIDLSALTRRDPPVARANAAYLQIEISNGFAPGVLRAHLYDLGRGRGFRLVGIERI